MKKTKLNIYRVVAALFALPLFLNMAVGILTDFLHGLMFRALQWCERKLKS